MKNIKKTIFLITMSASMALVSCLDEPKDPEVIYEEQVAAINRYISNKNLNAQTEEEFGLRYIITAEGDTAFYPQPYDSITVSYVLRLFNTQEIIHQENNIKVKLDDQIGGWQILMPLLQKGGSMTMFIPSKFAFGDAKIGSIPRNSAIITEVQLHSISHLTTQQQLAYDQKRIDAYLEKNDLEAQKDPPTGLRFIINDEGNGDAPTPNDDVNLSYEAYLLDDKQLYLQQFNSEIFIDIVLSEQGILEGWRTLMPYVKEGGSIRMFIPSVYAFGTEKIYNVFELSTNVLPSNAVLVYDIRLHRINK